MDLRHLRYFVAVAEAGHMTRAAAALGIQQPPLSQQIRALEDELGLPLLVRHPKGVALTDGGRALLADARRILADIEDMEHQLSRSMAEPRGLLRVNATLGFGRAHVAPVISRFCKAHPQVQVQFHLSVAPPPLSEAPTAPGVTLLPSAPAMIFGLAALCSVRSPGSASA